MLLQLFIINKNGGVIFSKNLSQIAPQCSDNDYLRLGSTFHGLHAILQQVAPVSCNGIEIVETDSIRLNCYQTATGLKILITSLPLATDIHQLILSVYEIYCDYALKSPLYEMDMPIRCDLFSLNLEKLVLKYNQKKKS